MFYLLHVLPPSSNWKKEDPELDKQKTVDAWMDAVPRVKKKTRGGRLLNTNVFAFLALSGLSSFLYLSNPLLSLSNFLFFGGWELWQRLARSGFFGEITPQQVWAEAICHSLIGQSGFPAPSNSLPPFHCPSPPPPPPAPPPSPVAVHHILPQHNNEPFICKDLIINPPANQTPNLSHFFQEVNW